MENLFIEILKKIENSQSLLNKNDGIWKEEKGYFNMDIHFNFTGNELMTEARKNIKIPDYNPFITNFIIFCLLEIKNFNYVNINKKLIKNSVEVILESMDQNFGNSSYCFWKQKYDETNKIYVQYPTNYKKLVDNASSFTNENFKSLFGINKSEQFNSLFNNYVSKKCLSIPSDLDSTFVSITTGAILSNFKNEYSDLNQLWQSKNNIKNLLNSLEKYTYRPFSNNINQNSIDPRSYYFLKDFIIQWVESGKNKDDLIIPMSFFMNIDEQIQQYPFIQTPSLSNHIDISILSNILYGLISIFKNFNDTKLTNDMKNVLLSTVSVIEYVFKSKLIYSRPDLIVFYYPSLYPLFWFITRSLYSLREFKIYSNNIPTIFNDVLNILNSLCENEITKEILTRVTQDGINVYWEDFLGNGDNINGESVKFSEDRFFSTALAINSLIDTWSEPKEKGCIERIWRSNTPIIVIDIVNNSCQYIIDNILTQEDMDNNIFFSSHTKGKATHITNYPSNIDIDVTNGKKCNNQIERNELLSKKTLISLVSGIMDNEEYNKKLDESKIKWNGNFNEYPFIYWSSPALTFSCTLLALSKFKSLNK